MVEEIIIAPRASRLAEGLRDTGYDFFAAVLDIVDNSIAADAENVSVFLDIDITGEPILAISDDGRGMDRDGLIEAMRYGAKPRPSPRSLGKFGLGLKTASTAFCRHLTLISRANAGDPPLAAILDLDYLDDTWKIKLGSPEAEWVHLLDETAPNKAGTVVVWQNVDRFLETYADPTGKPRRNALDRVVEDLRWQLGMVFQRFLAPSDAAPERKINILLNGTPVEAWSPFFESYSRKVVERNVKVIIDGNEHSAQLRGYVLPRAEDFPVNGLDHRISLDLQGFYVYRENRLIQYGDWLGIQKKTSHFNLCRIEFSFDHQLDELFRVDVKKSRIELHHELRNTLDKISAPIRRAAEMTARKGIKNKLTKLPTGPHLGSNRVIAKNEDEASDGVNGNVINNQTGDVEIKNPSGSIRTKIRISPAVSQDEVHVSVVDGINDGILFEPGMIQGENGQDHFAVFINKQHVYYERVYVPNLSSGVIVQGMDSLLWALAMAELYVTTDSTKKALQSLRYDMSRRLRLLAEELPEPRQEDLDAQEQEDDDISDE